MANLRELKKRLRSVKITEQVTGAMRTSSTIKLSQITNRRRGYALYTEALQRMSDGACGACTGLVVKDPSAPPALVLLSGSRGLCGGFHRDLQNFFLAACEAMETKPSVISVGRIGEAFLREEGIESVAAFDLSDIPTPEENNELCSFLSGLLTEGKASSVTVYYEKYISTMHQEPAAQKLFELPPPREGETVLLLPDRAAVAAEIGRNLFTAALYDLVLQHACGLQAATLIAMRSASDNAEDAIRSLSLTIDRERQAAVTQSVIETASASTVITDPKGEEEKED